ncbi:hypothetical protein [Treponema sp. OMZ 788]|uniref:hypothetical protein n=1 Tax=Treponema sp. OMZ 788 TaxID=2563664 RepID=UPI0020A45D40|nr:hypothetical protein [Treponema sp. OMZ 788]
MPQIDAESYILIHAKTGTILAEHNAEKQIPPASLTKLVTIYTMLQNPDVLGKKLFLRKRLGPFFYREGLHGWAWEEIRF